MSKVMVAMTVLLTVSALAAACGGKDDGGLLKGLGQQQPARNATAVAPDLPRQQAQPALPNLPNLNLPQALPSVQVPEVRTGTGSTTGACALVTRQDAATVLGKPVNEAKSMDIPRQNLGIMTVDMATCSYNATDGPGQVGVETWKGSDARAVQLIVTASCTGKEKINGLGDNACWDTAEHRQLVAVKGLTFINLSARGAPNENLVRDLAKKVVDRVQ
jgi:hypothetical protein